MRIYCEAEEKEHICSKKKRVHATVFISFRRLAGVVSCACQEAFLGLILLTVTGLSAMTEGLGLSNTLGAFLAGVLLSETKYRYQVRERVVCLCLPPPLG